MSNEETQEFLEWLIALDEPGNEEQRRRVSLDVIIARARAARAVSDRDD